jgi:uncharacterized protein (TIGR02246 family)
MKQMVFRTAITLVTVAVLTTYAVTQTKSRTKTQGAAAIRAVLDAQRDAWNRGDVEGYMDGYERSAETVLVSGDDVIRGWQTVTDRYKKNYNTPDKMGTLTFSDLEITPLDNNAAVVLGRWHLKRSSDEPHGRFTLVFRRTKAGWKIIHDHTSSV